MASAAGWSTYQDPCCGNVAAALDCFWSERSFLFGHDNGSWQNCLKCQQVETAEMKAKYNLMEVKLII